MNKVVLKEKVVNDVLEYLSTKPYREVVELIDDIKLASEIVNDDPKVTPPTPKPEVSY